MKNTKLLIENGVDLKKSLELFGDMLMYDESLGDFLAEIENKISKISHFKEINDLHNYNILVHSLKSDAKYFGFVRLAELAYEHEIQSKDKNIMFVKQNYKTLVSEANKVVRLVKDYFASGINNTDENVLETKNDNIKLPLIDLDINKQTILVADDSIIITNFVKKVFENNYNVLVANDGEEALSIISQNSSYNIIAILLDLTMPKVDGFKVLEFMEKNQLFKLIPVSIITGNDSVDINLNAFEYPIVDILKKPFSEMSAQSILERTIQSKM